MPCNYESWDGAYLDYKCACPVSGDAAQDLYEMNRTCCGHEAYEHSNAEPLASREQEPRDCAHEYDWERMKVCVECGQVLPENWPLASREQEDA